MKKTFHGALISTEPAIYDPDSNVAVFSEILEISRFNSKSDKLIILELFQHENDQIISIAKRVLEINTISLLTIVNKFLFYHIMST